MTLSSRRLKEFISGRSAVIASTAGINPSQIQPASFDCTLGDRAYRVVTSFLPRPGETVADLLQQHTIYDFQLGPESVLEPHVPYVIPLRESLRLPAGTWAKSNPKSSIGRVDVFVRLLADGNPQFDVIPDGYAGPLYLEIIPLSFLTRVQAGLALSQIRFFEGNPSPLTAAEYREMQSKVGLVFGPDGQPLKPEQLLLRHNKLLLEVDLSLRNVIGYRAKRNTRSVLDLSRKGTYPPADFFEPIQRPPDGQLVLDPQSFYLLATRQRVAFPPDVAGEIEAYDPSAGELRSHYAGFFDPGFGYGAVGKERGTSVVLEVRAHDIPFRLTDGQAICAMVYEQMKDQPEELYGSGIGSTYTGQGPMLSKFFKNEWQ